jgi:glycerol-3-phosphate acyltransferase PlsY
MLGVALALNPLIGLLFAVVWISMLFLTRISSAGGMSAAIAAPVAAFALDERRILPALAAMGALVLWKHRPNIIRLMKGTEPRVGQKTDPA